MRSILHALLGYAATLVAFLALDAAWLGLFAIEMFNVHIGAILREAPNVGAVVAFYVVYAAGLHVLAVRPARQTGSLRQAAASGALVGLTAYATFDLTNLAIIAGWPLELAIADMTWGTVASALAATAGYTFAAWSENRARTRARER